MSEAHNSLEQLNSNWSEKNMEQQTRLASLLKEVDELRNRLTQAEERELSQREMNQRLKETTEMEVLKLLIKQCALISYPDLLSSKPQVRSSQVNILATASSTRDLGTRFL